MLLKDWKTREALNFDSVIQKSKSILNSWLQRDLSIFECILITKIETLSRVMYPAFSLAISDNLIKPINQFNFNFFWKNKRHYLRKGDVVKSVEEGDLNGTDYEAINGMIKLK